MPIDWTRDPLGNKEIIISPPINRHDLIQILKYLRVKTYSDTEVDHMKTDEALLAFINDPEITKLFKAIPKWYA